MKSKIRYLLLIATVLLAASLLTGVYVYFGNEKEAQAQSVVSYQTITLEDGTTPYTETTYSSAVLVGYYGVVQIHAYGEMTLTDNFTVTPYFSNEPVGCASIDATTGWFVTREHVPYVNQSSVIVGSSAWETTTVTTTVTTGAMTEGTLTVTMIASNTVMGREVDVLGRCFRVKMEGPANFTPTVYIRLVNRQ